MVKLFSINHQPNLMFDEIKKGRSVTCEDVYGLETTLPRGNSPKFFTSLKIPFEKKE